MGGRRCPVRQVESLLRSRGVAVHGLPQAEPVAAAVASFLEHQISALAIYDGERLAGLFTKNDLVRCCAHHGERTLGLPLSEVMKADLYTTTPGADLDDVMEVMVRRGFRHVPVLEGERMVGMVTSQDILAHQNEILQIEREELRRYIQGSY
jgi:CBS domain-containing protein